MRYLLLCGAGLGNVVEGTVSMSVLYLFSYVAGNTMSQLLSVWEGVHPLKWVGYPLKCNVHPCKSFLSGLVMGSI